MSLIQAYPLEFTPADALILALKNWQHPVVLESGNHAVEQNSAVGTAATAWVQQQGRFTIAAANPERQLAIWQAADLALLEELEHKPSFSLAPQQSDLLASLPFIGGWLGYWSYDADCLLGQLDAAATPESCAPEIDAPLIWLGYYPWALITDHQLQQTWLVGEVNPKLWAQIKASLAAVEPPGAFQLATSFSSNLTLPEYLARFAKIQNYLTSGELELVNFAHRFTASYSGDIYAAWLALRKAAQAPFAACLDFGQGYVMSLSPEAFIKVSAEGQLETRPIKGTRPRGGTAVADARLAQELASSTKDRNENLVTVELIKQELSQVCDPASIQTPQLAVLESHTRVHHLVSCVTGQLKTGVTTVELFRACFPPSSIAGVPKLKAKQVIAELEPNQRSVYCGALGYLDRRGGLHFNVAIRTLLAVKQQLYLGAGGGITQQSEAYAEYQETLDKVDALIKCLQPNFNWPTK